MQLEMQSKMQSEIFFRDIPTLSFGKKGFYIEQWFFSNLKDFLPYLLTYTPITKEELIQSELLVIRPRSLNKSIVYPRNSSVEKTETQILMLSGEEVKLFEKDCNENIESLKANLERLLNLAKPKTDPSTLREFVLSRSIGNKN